MRDYSVYDITPPNLFILSNGPYIYMGGMSEEERTKIKSIFEGNIYDSEIAFFYNVEPINEENLAWTEIAIKQSNFIIVNVENITAIEQYLVDGMLTAEDEDVIVVFYSRSGSNSPLARLLSSNGEVVIFNLNEVELILKEILESK